MNMPRIFKTSFRKICAVVIAVLVAVGVWALLIEPASINVRRVSLQIPSWHAEHRDMKIALLTDLHVGAPHMGLEKLRRVVERTNDEKPDLILLLGDLAIGDQVSRHTGNHHPKFRG